jgi:AcrR family transcriptional regulator
MGQPVADVKGKRRYNASGRFEQAQRNRAAVLREAERLFLERGYADTTVAAIASEASVSVETVYKAFGGKAGLVRAIYDRGLIGTAAVPAYQRSDEMRARESDPVTIMREWGLLTAEVAALVTPIRLLIRSASATDAELATLLDDSDAERLDRMLHHARFLHQRGYLRDDVTLAEAADILWTCSSAELYELLVLKRNWARQRFAHYIAEFMIAALLPAQHHEGA